MTMTTLPTVGHRARAMRLDPFAMQRVFDALLHTMSRPGELTSVDVPEGVPAALLPVVTLADVEVGVAVLEDGDVWAEAVRAVTGARQVPLAEAGVVVALRPLTAADVLALRRGSAEAPEDAARLVAAVDALGPDDGALPLRLRGPGVPGERGIAVTGVDRAVVRALGAANAEFPAGVDAHLVATDGTVASIPRGVTIRLEED